MSLTLQDAQGDTVLAVAISGEPGTFQSVETSGNLINWVRVFPFGLWLPAAPPNGIPPPPGVVPGSTGFHSPLSPDQPVAAFRTVSWIEP